MGKQWKQWLTLFWGAPKSLQMVIAATKLKDAYLDSVGEGKGGMFRKNSMYIIYSETDHQPRWDARDKCLGMVHWEDPEESGGEGDGRGDRDGEYM